MSTFLINYYAIITNSFNSLIHYSVINTISEIIYYN